MSEHTEVTKVVENVDRLFSEIVVNGESHVSDRYVPPEPVNTPVLSTNQSDSEEEQTAEQNDEPVQGEYVKAVELNNVLHDFNDEELAEQVNDVKTDVINLNSCVSCICSDIADINSQLGGVRYDICCLNGDIGRIDTCIGVVQTDVGRLNNRVANAEGSITCLQTDVGNISGNVCCLQGDVGDLQTCTGTLCCCIDSAQGQIDGIEELIPNQASCSNQLADKDFVNSSIATNTANFLGTYTSLAQIEAIPNPTNNDYAFLQTTDQCGNTLYQRYKYNSSSTQWVYEYDLNNSSFTAEQWATINSGLTQNSVCSDISSAIGALDVASAGGSGKFISEIQQTDGKICATESCIASCVASGDSSPVSSDAVFNAIGALCAQASGGSGKYISAIQQTDGKVLATEGTLSNTVQSGDYAPVTSDAVAQAIAGAGVTTVDAVVSGCMSPITSNAVANWSPSNAGLANCAKLVYLDSFTADADRPIMVACPRGSTGYSDQGVVTSGCDISYNPYNGFLKLKSYGKTACVAHMNASALHIYTDAPAIAFNQNVLVANANSVVTACCFCGNLCGASLALSYAGAGDSVVTAYQTGDSWCGSASNWASYLVFNHGNGETYYNQMIRMPFWGVPQYQRKENGTNMGWHTFITDENIGSQTVCDSSLLNGYGSSTSATANCIVRRDANGYIYGSYFRSNIGDENINSYSGTALIFSDSDKWFRRTPPSCVCVGSAGAVWYGSAVFCIWCSGGAYWICNRCSFPAILTPLSTQIDSCYKREVIGGFQGLIFAGGACCCMGTCSTYIGDWNTCVGGTRVY